MILGIAIVVAFTAITLMLCISMVIDGKEKEENKAVNIQQKETK